MPHEPAQRFRGPVLPDGEARDLYVVDGRVTYEPQPGADTVAEGWIVPGLVDAHCHLGLDDSGAVDDAATEEQAVVVMERLRTAIARADWSDLPLSSPVTVSVGLATAPHIDDQSTVGWRALFNTADLHLFNAKRGGRNGWRLAPDPRHAAPPAAAAG